MLNKKPTLIVLSLAIAMFLWVYVTGNVDPETKTKVSNIPIVLMNADDLAEQDLAVTQDKTLTATAVIKGKRSNVNQAKINGLTATIDVSNAQKGENELDLEFDTPQGVTIDSSTITKYTVMVENLVSKSVPVRIEFGKVQNEDTYPWATVVTPNQVTIYGAESVVSKVKDVRGTINGDDVALNAKTVRVGLIAHDKVGAHIEGLQYDRSYVMATVQLLNSKNVPLNIQMKNLDNKYTAEDVTGDKVITIFGTPEALSKVTSIDAKADLSHINKTGVIHANIEEKLPYGVYTKAGVNIKSKFVIKEAN